MNSPWAGRASRRSPRTGRETTAVEGGVRPVGKPPTAIETALWFGLVTGFLELAILLTRHVYAGSGSLGSLQMNRNFVWMVPTAHLAIFGTIGLVGSCLGLARRGLGRRVVMYASVALAAFALLMMVRGLYSLGAAALAIGIATRLAPWLLARGDRFRRLVRISLPLQLGVVAVAAGVSYDRTVLAERRAAAALPAARAGAPNVLFIVLDTVRADRMSLYGHSRDTTPNLARLAARGVVFDEARSAAPWTLPSHASMFTGRWPHELNVGAESPLDGAYPTLAEFLSRQGYATAGFIGNTYFCNSWYGLDRGFAHYEDYYEQNVIVSPAEALRCTALGRRVIESVGAYDARPGDANALKDAERINRDTLRWVGANRSRPFFAFLNYVDVHDPYQTPPGFDRHFGLKPETPADFELIRAWHGLDKKLANGREKTLIRDAYDDCLAYLDDQLGRLFADLERQGVLENTLVVVTSDHGESLGEHKLFGHGMSLYRPEVHVPLLIFGPRGIPGGKRVEAPVSLRDLPVTIASLVGTPGQSPFPGRPLVRFWDASNTAPEETILSEVTVRMKVSKNPDRPPAMRGPMASALEAGKVYLRDAVGREELYDVGDRDESANLADSPADRAELHRLRATLDRSVPQGQIMPAAKPE